MKQLTGQDNGFLELEKLGLPQHIASLQVYDQSTAPNGLVRYKDILQHIDSRKHLSPIFTSKLLPVPFGVDRPYLVEDDALDLEYHVRHMALPKPGDWRQLCILLSRINARSLDLSRPLWELYVIEGLNGVAHLPKGCFALFLKMHHCVMDGASGAIMLAAIHDFDSTPRIIPPERRTVERAPTVVEQLGVAYLNTLRRPKTIVELASKVAGIEINKLRMNQSERGSVPMRKVLTRFNREISPHRVLDSVAFDFAALRAIKNSHPGATINDVMLSIVSGALHKYLGAKKELPKESLVCGCPVDVRVAAERESGGNMIGVMGVELGTQIADPAERLQAIHAASVLAKIGAQASDTRVPNQLQDAVPGGILTMALRVSALMNQNITPYNVILTNVPGPPNQLYFAGAQIVDGFGVGALVPGVGLFHTASSSVQNNVGKLNLSFFACRDQLPDPEFYRECIEESFKELYAATVKKATAKKATPKKVTGQKKPTRKKNTPAKKKSVKKKPVKRKTTAKKNPAGNKIAGAGSNPKAAAKKRAKPKVPV